MNGRTLLLVAVGIASLAALVFLLPNLLTYRSDGWRLRAEAPLLIGTAADPFIYAGGDAVRRVDGEATLRFDPGRGRGTLRMEIQLPADFVGTGLPFDALPGALLAVSAPLVAEKILVERAIGGDTEIGDSRLPQTEALLAGTALFEVSVDSRTSAGIYRGFWSVANGLRRADGSIGQQGLVFSPLLREKTGFSDSTRKELTLLLYGGNTEETAPVLLHVVFGSVTIEQAPDSAAP